MHGSAWHDFLVGLRVAALVVVVGILTGWVRQPGRLRNWHVWVLLVVAGVLSAVPFDDLVHPDRAGGAAAPATADSPVSVRGLAPDLADRLVLTDDDSSGSPVLFSSRLDGTDRQRVWSIGSDLRPAFVPGGTDLVVPQSTDTPDQVRLEVRTVTGDLVRVLTRPEPGQEDVSPAVVAAAGTKGTVYFVREYWTPVGGGTSTLDHSVVMRVPLDRGSAESAVRTPVPLGSVSVSEAGGVMAGQCANPDTGGPTQACVVHPAGGTVTRIPGSEHSTVSDVAVSPDGTRVAYSSSETNPYGDVQVYVYDLASGQTTELSRLPGVNDQPAWPDRSRTPCLAFHHGETGGESVYLGCLTPDPVTAEAVPTAKYPVWFPPS